MSLKPTTVPSKRLAASITSASTTFQISEILGWDGTDLEAADFGTVAYGVFRNDTNDRMEIFQWDPSTIATGVLTFVYRGMPYDGTLGTEVSGNKQSWVKNETIVELGTDVPQLIGSFMDIQNDQTVAGVKTFSSFPKKSGSTTPVDQDDFATKAYIDGVALAGAPNASTAVQGVVEEATQAEVDAGTSTGGTGAKLFVTPDKRRSKLINDYLVDTGSATAYVVTPTNAVSAYVAGQTFIIKAATTNSGAATLNVSGLGAKDIKKNISEALTVGDISAGEIITVIYDGTNFQLVSRQNTAYGTFGDGSDGDVTISSPTTLTRDMYYNNLVITDVLTTGGFRVFVKGTVSGAGTIKVAAGNAGSGATAGAAASTGYFRNTAGANGGAGATSGNNPGSNGSSPTACLGTTTSAGSTGGASGNGNAGGAGGSAGTATVPYEFGRLAFNTLTGAIFGQTSIAIITAQAGAPGGGSGGGTGATAGGSGGGGGASGGIVFLAARYWTGTFTIEAVGGNGGNGSNGANGSYGGGGGAGGNGGNGGCAVVIHGFKSWTGSFTLTAGNGGTAGSGGTGSGNPNGSAGTAGVAGVAGSSYQYPVMSLLH